MTKKEYLNAQTKHRVIENLQTGDLLKFKADTFLPLLYHYGIVSFEGGKKYIYHLQTSRENKYGGNLIRDNFDEYVKGREILEVQNLKLNREEFQEVLEKIKKEKYNVFTNNCEHFVHYLKDKKAVSPQLKAWGLAVSLGVLTYLFINKK